MRSMTAGGRWTRLSAFATLLAGLTALCLPLIEWLPRGSVVGWLLVIVGAAELAFGAKSAPNTIGRPTVASGLLTLTVGLFLISGAISDYLPVRNLITLWLLLRGSCVLVLALARMRDRIAAWLAFSAVIDLLLGVLLLLGLSGSFLVVMLFGPTPLIVAKFSLFIATSLIGTAISQFMIASQQEARG